MNTFFAAVVFNSNPTEDHLVGEFDGFCGDFERFITSFEMVDITSVNVQQSENLQGK